ncbi:FemAB family PEP-CTERM system-associated protein [Phenylobacterium sp. LjRoot219]|uniref:FemAB family XrtA/PEP-CTERM system-associated protein n=1 Tax=Phenylobacterium sp. LjRoot219 TaxID=3342283 RepID=UPI003ED0CF9E
MFESALKTPSTPRVSRLAAPAAAWDDFVAATEESTFCHLSGWGRIMQEVFGHEFFYLVAHDEAGAWQGVLPLVRVRSRLTGQHLISVPYLNDGGPLGREAARAALARHAIELAEDYGVKLLELRSRKPIPLPLPAVSRKITVHLALPTSAEELWREGFRAKLRSQIRRPLKAEIKTRFGADQIDAFYLVFARSMRDLGTPVLPRRFFEMIAETFPQHVIFEVVYHQGKPVGGACGFLWRDEFEITWAATLREYNSLSPNMLLYWTLMAQVIERGARRFNFGRCTPGSNSHRFKLQWGGDEVPLPWLQWPCADDGHAAPDGPWMQLASQSWRRLPLPVANRVGPLLARHLPWY